VIDVGLGSREDLFLGGCREILLVDGLCAVTFAL
jgi:type IV secretory pathway TrbD component